MDELNTGKHGSEREERSGDFLARPLAVASGVANAATGAANAVAGAAQAAGDAAGRFFDGFGRAAESEEPSSTVRDEDGAYIVPDPILDVREEHEITELTERYERMCEPSVFSKAADRVVDALPDAVKDLVKDASDKMSQQELYTKVMEVVAKGFDAVEKASASMTVDAKAVIKQINNGPGKAKIEKLDEICLLRVYDVAAVAHRDNLQHTVSAFIEGGATGAPGFAGIPFNIVLSTFVYYRAVPVVGGVIGALFDTGQMQKILEFADLFYPKRFLVEKATRIEELVNGTHTILVIDEDGGMTYSVE